MVNANCFHYFVNGNHRAFKGCKITPTIRSFLGCPSFNSLLELADVVLLNQHHSLWHSIPLELTCQLPTHRKTLTGSTSQMPPVPDRSPLCLQFISFYLLGPPLGCQVFSLFYVIWRTCVSFWFVIPTSWTAHLECHVILPLREKYLSSIFGLWINAGRWLFSKPLTLYSLENPPASGTHHNLSLFCNS